MPREETDKPAHRIHNVDLVDSQVRQVIWIHLLTDYLDTSTSQRIKPMYF